MGLHHYNSGQSSKTRSRTKKSSANAGRKRWYAQRFFLINGGIVLFLVLYSIFGDDGIVQSLSLRDRIIKSQLRCDSLTDLNKDLNRQIRALQANEEHAIEAEARELGMIKKGEKVYLIVKKDSVTDK